MCRHQCPPVESASQGRRGPIRLAGNFDLRLRENPPRPPPRPTLPQAGEYCNSFQIINLKTARPPRGGDSNAVSVKVCLAGVIPR